MIREIVNSPTGEVVITQGKKGLLEFISVGDYGKEKNLKADFLGLTKEINGVPHGDLLPLEEKWVTTISTQYGCSMNCAFCDVPKVGKGVNATLEDMIMQVDESLSLHPEVKHTKRFNLHFARMGEPSFNHDVIKAATILSSRFKSKGWGYHPVVSTMMPECNKNLKRFINDWMFVKNEVQDGEAGLQISVNTTDPESRRRMFSDNALGLREISEMLDALKVVGRKITLNFALTEAPIDATLLAGLFDPDRFLCKITPMHLTERCASSNLLTIDGYEAYYPYKLVEDELKAAGFNVIVFVPSIEEDEGLITCGHSVLGLENSGVKR